MFCRAVRDVRTDWCPWNGLGVKNFVKRRGVMGGGLVGLDSVGLRWTGDSLATRLRLGDWFTESRSGVNDMVPMQPYDMNNKNSAHSPLKLYNGFRSHKTLPRTFKQLLGDSNIGRTPAVGRSSGDVTTSIVLAL